VAKFQRALEVRLTQLLGRPSDVFYDEGVMSGTCALTPTIEKEVRASKILVTVLSPGYINSGWCNKELELFATEAGRRGGLYIDTQSRIVKAIKLPVDLDVQRRATVDLSDVLGYEFYRDDPLAGPLEFDIDADKASRLEFTKRVNTLAYDICKILRSMGDETTARDTVAPDSGKVVYLAETTPELADESIRLRRTLNQFGHTVLPSAPYPYGRTYADLSAADLARSDVSVHMIGSSYGPEREGRSIPEIQYDLAGDEVNRRPSLRRLVWSAPDVVPDEERQARFVTRLTDEATLVVSPFESFKTEVEDALRPKTVATGESVGEPAAPAVATLGRVYLIYDVSDAAAVEELDNWLFEHDYEVLHPISGGNESEIRQHDERCLVECDSVLLYWGAAPAYWLLQRVMDMQKAYAYGRSTPFQARGVVVGPNGSKDQTADKQRFRNKSIIKMELHQDFDPVLLTPFLSAASRMHGAAV
jgi:hypothetical protein